MVDTPCGMVFRVSEGVARIEQIGLTQVSEDRRPSGNNVALVLRI